MSSSFKLDGFDELNKELDKMIKAAEELEGENEIRLDELISDSFIRKHSTFQSFSEFSEQDIFKRYDSFESIPQQELDDFIDQNTDFSSFNELLESATIDYTSRQLGL